MDLKYCGSLHNHTEYSNLRLRDCIIKADDLFNKAEELGHSVCAVTDHDFCGGWMGIEELISKHPNLKIIRGNEIYLVRNGLNAENYIKEYDRYFHFILLAKDAIGAKQIMEISSRAWERSYMARGMRRVPTYYQDLFDIIGKNPGHVIGSTACLGGAIPTQLMRWRDGVNDDLYDQINSWINTMSNLFGKDNFYLELQPNLDSDQIYVNHQLIRLALAHKIGYIITTDSHYLSRQDRPIHKAFLNAQNGEREVDAFYATTYMMGTDEVMKNMDLTEAEYRAAFDNIQKIADMCEDYSIKKDLYIPNLKWREHTPLGLNAASIQYYFEKMPTLNKFIESEYESDEYFVWSLIEGIIRHPDLQNDAAYAEIEIELQSVWESSEVNKARWSSYFLNLQQIIDVCWSAGTLVGPSRGSGGGFVILYALDIIQMNALREPTKMYHWRFLNPKRASVLDIDTDIEGGRRKDVIKALKNYFGEDKVTQVATFRTESSKSAIQTACRGLRVDVDLAAYLSSLIPNDRGQNRSLKECYYGNEEKGFAPVKQFVIEMTHNFPEVWAVAQNIEGLINGSGIHAGGVILTDEPLTDLTALMRAPDGTLCTQFELHDAEKLSLIKMDLLSVEALDKMHNCLDLLSEYGYIEEGRTLRETYENVIGVYNLERDDDNMWKLLQEHKINSLFQMEKQSGIHGIDIAKPKNVKELAVLNSVIRLMASEKGAEQPLDMWGRYREDITQWYDEMKLYGLTEEQIDWLSHHPAITDGICESQEGLMALLQEPRLGGNDLSFADKVRKAIAKKIGGAFDECEKIYYENAEAKGCDMRLCHYVWDILFKVQRGYSFNASHTHAYSLVALQEMNLASRFPIIFWNCACLIANAGGAENLIESEDIDEEEYQSINDDEIEYDAIEDFVDIYEPEDMEEYDYVDAPDRSGKLKKKKVRAVDYGKIATALNRMKAEGIKIAPPSINNSHFTFAPDVENNTIIYGLSGITRISQSLVKEIIDNRPYSSIADLRSKVKLNKTQMINLIKCGALDEFGDRVSLMIDFITETSGPKSKLNGQNINMLAVQGLLPEELIEQQRTFFFNKDFKNWGYRFNERAMAFYEARFDMNKVKTDENGQYIIEADWKAQYQSEMQIIKDYIKAHHDELLEALNDNLFKDEWNKYCQGSISKWEIDSMNCYYHDHELLNVNLEEYGCVEFYDLPDEPTIKFMATNKQGRQFPIYDLVRICGTVLDRNKAKKTITILTTKGVVDIKAYGVFEQYDRQLSIKDEEGKKHVVEPSMFKRGTKIIACGIRTGENEFLAKTYKSTGCHHFERITNVVDGELIIQHDRAEVK